MIPMKSREAQRLEAIRNKASTALVPIPSPQASPEPAPVTPEKPAVKRQYNVANLRKERPQVPRSERTNSEVKPPKSIKDFQRMPRVLLQVRVEHVAEACSITRSEVYSAIRSGILDPFSLLSIIAFVEWQRARPTALLPAPK